MSNGAGKNGLDNIIVNQFLAVNKSRANLTRSLLVLNSRITTSLLSPRRFLISASHRDKTGVSSFSGFWALLPYLSAEEETVFANQYF